MRYFCQQTDKRTLEKKLYRKHWFLSRVNPQLFLVIASQAENVSTFWILTVISMRQRLERYWNMTIETKWQLAEKIGLRGEPPFHLHSVTDFYICTPRWWNSGTSSRPDIAAALLFLRCCWATHQSLEGVKKSDSLLFIDSFRLTFSEHPTPAQPHL